MQYVIQRKQESALCQARFRLNLREHLLRLTVNAQTNRVSGSAFRTFALRIAATFPHTHPNRAATRRASVAAFVGHDPAIG
jgi:hypothetical protein